MIAPVNPLTAVQQAIAGLVVIAVLVVAWFLFGLVSAKSKLEGIERADAATGRANKVFDKGAEQRKVSDEKYFEELGARAKKIDASGSFDATARDVYFQLLNDALSGPKR